MTEQATAEGNPRARVRARGRRELPLHQWCINEVTVQGVLTLPPAVTLEEISFDIGFALKRTATTIQPALRELGVTYLRENSPSMEAQGMLSGARTTIKRNAQEICRVLQLEYARMRVRRMKVSHNGVNAVFTAMTKQMPSGEGQRNGTLERVKVLGLVLAQNQTEAEVARLVRAIAADRVNCRYSVQPVHMVICTR